MSKTFFVGFDFPRLLVIGVALIAGASAACSSSTSTPASGGSADGGGGTGPGTPATTAKSPCQLLVRGDAEAAIGQPLPANAEDKVLHTCQWTTPDFVFGADITLGDWDSIKAAANAGKGVPVAVSGVGDEALNLNGAGGPSLLYVRKGGDGFLLNLSGTNIDKLPDHGLDLEKALAAKVIARF